jgi:hypothetical protein
VVVVRVIIFSIRLVMSSWVLAYSLFCRVTYVSSTRQIPPSSPLKENLTDVKHPVAERQVFHRLSIVMGMPHHRHWTCRVPVFMWHLPFDLCSKTETASSYANANVAVRVINVCKPPHPNKVVTPSSNSICIVVGVGTVAVAVVVFVWFCFC